MKKSLVTIPLMALMILPACRRDEMRGSNTTAVLDDARNAGDTVRTGDAEPNPGPQRTFSRYSFSPDGKTAILGDQHEAVLFDTDSGRLINRFSVPGSAARQAIFGPDGSRVGIEFGYHYPVIYGAQEPCQELFRIESPSRANRTRRYPAAFSPDGRRILYGSGLWDGNTGQETRQLHIVYD